MESSGALEPACLIVLRQVALLFCPAIVNWLGGVSYLPSSQLHQPVLENQQRLGMGMPLRSRNPLLKMQDASHVFFNENRELMPTFLMDNVCRSLRVPTALIIMVFKVFASLSQTP